MTSTKKTARLAGGLYLLLAITGVVSLMYVPNTLFVTGDAAATADNLRASEGLYRTGITSGVVANVIFVFLVLVLYRLFKEIDRGLAILMVALVLVSVSATFGMMSHQVGALVILEAPEFLSVFDQTQLDALTYLFLRIYSWSLLVIQIFWGLWLFPFGILVYRSRFIHKIIGLLLMVAGFAYVVSALGFLLVPQRIDALSTALMILAMGELPVILWLLIVGAKEQS